MTSWWGVRFAAGAKTGRQAPFEIENVHIEKEAEKAQPLAIKGIR
jgi:hypothetical protein